MKRQRISMTFSLFLIGLIVILGIGTLFGVVQYTRAQILQLFGERSFAFATFTMTEIDRSVQDNILRVETLAKRLASEGQLLEANATNANLENIDELIQRRDIAWTALHAGGDNALMQALIGSDLSDRLRSEFSVTAIAQNGTRYTPFTEVFLTDAYGANVAQTNRTSDYYQADEEWWQVAKETGLHVNDVAFDESANSYSIDISAAIRDGNGEFLGVVKVVWNVAEVIDLLQVTELERRQRRVFGDSTRLTLLTDGGEVIYTSDGNYVFLEPVSDFVQENIRELGQDGGLYVLAGDQQGKVTRFVTQARSTGFGEYGGLQWILVYEQDTSEVLAPIRSTALFVSIVISLFVLCLIYLAYMYTRRVRAIQALKDEFISIAAHELKAPLTSAGWSMDLLQEKQVSADIAEPVQLLRESVQRMNKLVEDLLNMSRLESGRLQVKPQMMDVTEVMQESVAGIQPIADQKKQTLAVHLPSKHQMMLDASLLRLMVTNLLSNAVKYSPASTTVTLDVMVGDQDLVIKVKDEGMGIPKEQQAKMFTKFFRADNARSSGTPGTGLGLFVIYNIAKSLGGSLRFVSEEGHGTTFTLSLPSEGMKSGKISLK